MSEKFYVGGIEGGATHSTIAILDPNGKQVSSVKSEGTNHWIIGMDECQNRIVDLVNRAKTAAGIPLDEPLAGLGLSLSGCEGEDSNAILENKIKTAHPNLSKSYVVCSDSVGALSTAEPDGGVVLISGTGSNALLINPDQTKFGCGGRGHMLGDEGSAWWIAHRAVKIVLDDQDKLAPAPYPTDTLWTEIKNHFNVETQTELFVHYYNNFNKSFIASLCLRLSKLAKQGDPLALHIFTEAGKYLARAIQALYPNADEILLSREGGLHVVCVGSVWLSFNLLQEGFVKQLQTTPQIKEISLLHLNVSGAVGAAYLASDHANLNIPKNYKENYSVFYNYKAN